MNTLLLVINLKTARTAIGILTNHRKVNSPAKTVSCKSASHIIYKQ
jgi:hypothetical protein